MKKTYIFKAILMMCLMLVGATVFTACDEDQLETDPYTGSVKLLAYGPNPVARMGELRILGVGLDKVQSVTIPGAGDIADINRISSEEIRITVPNEAVIGKITLNSATGKIESITTLKYTEPVGFDDNCFSAPEVKPGETLIIKGEYLNLVQSVIFAEDVVVDQIVNTRKEIKVVVPAEAQTGRVAISFCATEDTIPNLIASPVELKITLPAVNEVANLTGKKPGDKISQKGTNLDLVTKLTVADQEVEYTIADNAISYALPESTPAQATVSVWPASGVECPIAYIGMQLPTELKATPASEIKPGDKIVITGKDLDVVANVIFPGTDVPANVSEQSATSLTVTAPEGTQTGEIMLHCKSGAAASVAIVTAKPALEGYNPAPVNAGSDLTITGKNLELVSKITFTDNLSVDAFSAQSATSITLTVPVTAVSGEVVATMKNGETVTFSNCNINSPIFCFIPELPSADEEIKAGELCKVTVMNADKLTGVQVDGQDCQYILQGDVLYFAVPTNASPKSVTKLISSNGEVEYKISFKPNTEIVTTIWSDIKELGWSGDGQVYIGDDGGQSLIDAEAKAGDILRIKFQPTGDDWQVQIWEGHWGTQYDEINAGNYDLAGNGNYYNITLTDDLLATFTNKQWWGGILLVQGQSMIVTGLELVQKISLETNINGDCVKQDDQSVVWTFPSQMTWDDNGRFRILRNGPSDLKNFNFKAGKTIMRFYKSGTGQIQVNNPNWASFTTVADWEGSIDVLELVLTQDIIDCFTGATSDGWSETALILQGDGLTVSKITIE